MLELGDASWWALGAEPLLHGLLEAFDLAAGGRMIGSRVLLHDTETHQERFEAVASTAAAAGEPGREVEAVVGQRRRGNTQLSNGVGERVDHDRCRHPMVCSHREGIAGMIIEPGQHLDVDTIGEADVGHVGLPALVGLFGLEPDVTVPRPLSWGRRHETTSHERAVNRGLRHRHTVMVCEMPTDRSHPRIEPLTRQTSASRDDQIDHLIGRLRR
nr:hypothetical protein [Ilumatobacter nonamiensis]